MLEHTFSELNGRVALVGSSLGGFYAAYASERFGMRAVLVNPSAHPYQRMQMYRGSNENPYSGERYELDDSDVAALLQEGEHPLHRRRGPARGRHEPWYPGTRLSSQNRQ